MGNRKQYELLIEEIEALLAFIGPANDSLIDILPPLYDEIQEIMPDKLFAETAPLLRECRRLASRYKIEGIEEAPVVLNSLSSSISKVKEIINNYASANKYEPSLNRTYRERV